MTGVSRPARSRLVDGVLAAAALCCVLLVAAALAVPASPSALAAGVGGAVAVEYVLGRRRRAVRSAWERRPVKAATGAAFVVALALAAAVAPVALSLLAGGLVGYLALLAGQAVGAGLAPRK